MSANSTKLKLPVLLLLASLIGGVIVIAGSRAVDYLLPLVERQEDADYYMPLSDEAFAALIARIRSGYYERHDENFDALLKRIREGYYEQTHPRSQRK